MKSFVSVAAFVGGALAQSGAWGQCGGQGWTGPTSCVCGYECVYSNPWYSQCLPGGSSGSTLVTSIKTTTSATSSAVSPETTTLATSSATSTTKATTSTTSSTTSTTKATTSATSSATSTAKTTTPPTSSATSSKPVATSTSSPGGGSSTLGWKWLGSSESGPEFGEGNIPGVLGTDYIFPSTSAISTLISQGYNVFRLPFLLERMAPSTLTSSLDSTYLADYSAVVNYITGQGAYAVLDPHNYGRYAGNVITDTSAFETFWGKLAAVFKSNDKVIFDTNNEFHDMDQTLVLNLNQAAISGIRGAGATSQYIFVEGNAWSGAWSWNVTNDNLKALTDPQNKLVYEMHQYLDSDSSGKSAACASTDIGVQRIVGATEWLRANNKIGFLGEFAGGANADCLTAVKGLLDHLTANSDVWSGASWWSAGPWWGDYIFSFEPPSGTAYTYYNSLLKTYAP